MTPGLRNKASDNGTPDPGAPGPDPVVFGRQLQDEAG